MDLIDKLMACYEAAKQANSALYIEHECNEDFCGVVVAIMDTDAIVGSDFDLINEQDKFVDAIERLYDKIHRDGVNLVPDVPMLPPYVGENDPRSRFSDERS